MIIIINIKIICRVTVSLRDGSGSLPPAQTFIFGEPVDLDVNFSNLKPDAEYGKLCILEEPLTTGYTTMGRLIADMNIEKCYFSEFRKISSFKIFLNAAT